MSKDLTKLAVLGLTAGLCLLGQSCTTNDRKDQGSKPAGTTAPQTDGAGKRGHSCGAECGSKGNDSETPSNSSSTMKSKRQQASQQTTSNE